MRVTFARLIDLVDPLRGRAAAPGAVRSVAAAARSWRSRAVPPQISNDEFVLEPMFVREDFGRPLEFVGHHLPDDLERRLDRALAAGRHDARPRRGIGGDPVRLARRAPGRRSPRTRWSPRCSTGAGHARRAAPTEVGPRRAGSAGAPRPGRCGHLGRPLPAHRARHGVARGVRDLRRNGHGVAGGAAGGGGRARPAAVLPASPRQGARRAARGVARGDP